MTYLNHIKEIQQDYVNQKTEFMKKSQKIESRVEISKYIMNKHPIPIQLIDTKNLEKNNEGMCIKCSHKSFYKFNNEFLCEKHIHSKLIDNILIKN